MTLTLSPRRNLRGLHWLCLKALRLHLKKPWVLVALTVLAFGLAVKSIPKLHYKISTNDLVDARLESSVDFENLKSTFNLRPSAFMLIRPAQPGGLLSSEDLCRIQHAFLDVRDEFYQIYSISSALDLRIADYHDSKLWYPLFIDPCNDKNPTDMAKLRGTPWADILTSYEAKDLVAQVALFPLKPPGRFGVVDIIHFDQITRELEKKIALPISWAGEMTFNSYFLQGIKRTQILNLTALLILILLLRFAHGTFRSGFLFVTIVLITNTIIHGAMGFFGYDVNPLTAGVFFLIMISSLEDFMFVSGLFLNAPPGDRKLRWRTAFRRVLMPGLFTSLTTAVGFLSLCVSNLEAIREFGLWTSCGAILEWFTTFFILTALISYFPKLATWVRPERVPWMQRFRLHRRNVVSKPLTIACLIAMPTALWLGLRIDTNSTPIDMLPKSHPMQKDVQYMLKNHGWIADLSLVFTNDMPRANRDAILEKVRALPTVKAVDDHDDEIDYLAKGYDKFVRELVDMEVSISPQGESIKSHTGSQRAVLFVSRIDLQSILTLKKQVANICGSRDICYLAGDLVAFSDFSLEILRTLFSSLSLSVLLVGLIIFWAATALKTRQRFALLVSTVWGPLLLLALISLAHVPINIVSCVVLSVVVGLTGDNAVQYIFAAHKKKVEDGIDRVGISSVQCGVIMALAALILLGSYFQPVRYLGVLLSAALLMSLFGDLWLLRGLLALFKAKRD